MTLNKLTELIDGKILSMGLEERQIKGGYVCDLLSFVISGVKPDDAWITIQAHENVVAVAELADAACIVIAQDISVPDSVVEAAKSRGIGLVSSPLTAFEICVCLGQAL